MKDLKSLIFWIFFFIVALATISCKEKKKFEGYLYPIMENGLYGYIDSVGNRIIEPKFLWVSPFTDGLAMVVVDTIYREVLDSVDFEVNARDTISEDYRMLVKYGYIDKTGKFAINPTLISYVSMPEDGFHISNLASCSNALSRHIFFSKRALYYDTTNWKNGYIDVNGVIVIKPQFYYSEPFSYGRAIVKRNVSAPIYYDDMCLNPSKLRCSYIDTLGNIRTIYNYEKLTKFNGRRGIGTYYEILRDSLGNLNGFTVHNDIVDIDGEVIKNMGIWNAYYGYTSDGISVAKQVLHEQVYDGMFDIYSFVNEDGEYLGPLKGLTEFQIDSLRKCNDIIQVLPEDALIAGATIFRDGFAGITPDRERWFIIDKYLIIHGYGKESIFEAFHPFSNGLAAVKRNGKWGYINRKIKEQIPCKYDSCGLAYPFLEEIFEYDIQGNIAKVAYINRNDSLVWESKIPDMEEIKNKYSGKDKKNWGKWTYNENSFQDIINIWNIAAFGFILFVIIALWKTFSTGTSKNQVEIEIKPFPSVGVDTSTSIETSSINVDDDIHYYPSVGQYTETIKLAAESPEDYFDKLNNLRPVLDANGEPIMSSGNFAVVYKMEDDKGKFYAVRCFHREQEGRERSYRLICEELAKVSSPYLLPITYLEKELFVESGEYPVLLMDWVEGLTLDKYIRKHINDKRKLRSLADNFRQLAIWLLNQPFAHGDLKPDNIMVKKNDSLVLVDYDGMFVPAMEGQKARELGSPDFRNPIRVNTDFDKYIDTFPVTSILLSLELLVENKDYLSKYGKEDRLLFSEDDYRNIDNNVLFRIALSSYNDDISELAVSLKLQLTNIQDNNIIPLLKMKEIRYKQEQKNEKIEKSLTFIILLYSLFVPLGTYLFFRFTPETDWTSLGVSAGILCTAIFLYFVMLIIDLFRPYKKYHLFINKDYTSFGCVFSFWDIFIAIGLILNSLINCVWYITLLIIIIWICFFYVLGGIIYGAFDLRTCIYKTPTEKRIEMEAKERDKIRTNLRIEEQRQKKLEKNGYNNDDLPF